MTAVQRMLVAAGRVPARVAARLAWAMAAVWVTLAVLALVFGAWNYDWSLVWIGARFHDSCLAASAHSQQMQQCPVNSLIVHKGQASPAIAASHET